MWNNFHHKQHPFSCMMYLHDVLEFFYKIKLRGSIYHIFVRKFPNSGKKMKNNVPPPTPHPSPPPPRPANYYSIFLVRFVLDLALALPTEELLGLFGAVNIIEIVQLKKK